MYIGICIICINVSFYRYSIYCSLRLAPKSPLNAPVPEVAVACPSETWPVACRSEAPQQGSASERGSCQPGYGRTLSCWEFDKLGVFFGVLLLQEGSKLWNLAFMLGDGGFEAVVAVAFPDRGCLQWPVQRLSFESGLR